MEEKKGIHGREFKSETDVAFFILMSLMNIVACIGLIITFYQVLINNNLAFNTALSFTPIITTMILMYPLGFIYFTKPISEKSKLNIGLIIPMVFVPIIYGIVVNEIIKVIV